MSSSTPYSLFYELLMHLFSQGSLCDAWTDILFCTHWSSSLMVSTSRVVTREVVPPHKTII